MGVSTSRTHAFAAAHSEASMIRARVADDCKCMMKKIFSKKDA